MSFPLANEEVEDLARKFDTAVENNPGVPRPDLMVLRHTHVHPADEPEGWRRPAEGIQKYYRTFDAWFGNKTTPKNGFLEPSRKVCRAPGVHAGGPPPDGDDRNA